MPLLVCALISSLNWKSELRSLQGQPPAAQLLLNPSYSWRIVRKYASMCFSEQTKKFDFQS